MTPTSKLTAEQSESDRRYHVVQLPCKPGSVGSPERLFSFSFPLHDTTDRSAFGANLPVLQGTISGEQWLDFGPVAHGADGLIVHSASSAHLVANTDIPAGQLVDTEQVVAETYAGLLRFCEARGFHHIVRAWNFIPEINSGDGDFERYRRFSVGRAEAFDDMGIAETRLPAGTAIGVGTQDPLSITVLAAMSPPQMISNPRQIDAYHYPCEHGPRSPSFSRAALLKTDTQYCLLVSGTASVVGHRSMHPADVTKQTHETCVNLTQLLNDAGYSGSASKPVKAAFRVYIRYAKDFASVREIHQSYFPGVPTTYLQGDICRRELLVETEAVFSW